MRLFITSYHKSGTHQIMPALEADGNYIVDYSGNNLADVPERFKIDKVRFEDSQFGIENTSRKLATFLGPSFGHVTCLPEYVEALQAQPTKVLFNVRDPRDVIIAIYCKSREDHVAQYGTGLWNFFDEDAGCPIMEKPGREPITDLIEIEASRWPKWLPWIKQDFVRMVKYEDLRLNGLETLKEIAEWLEPHHVDPVACAMRLKPRPRNPTFRTGLIGEYKTAMEEYQIEMANDLLGDIIKTLGYEL